MVQASQVPRNLRKEILKGTRDETLLELVQEIDVLNEEEVIFARPQWAPESEAKLFRLTEDYKKPEEPKLLGLDYFLEVHVAREVLEAFVGKPHITTRQKCERLIQYALHDA